MKMPCYLIESYASDQCDKLYYDILSHLPINLQQNIVHLFAHIVVTQQYGCNTPSVIFIAHLTGLQVEQIQSIVDNLEPILKKRDGNLVIYKDISPFLYNQAQSKQFFVDKNAWDLKIACAWIQSFYPLYNGGYK